MAEAKNRETPASAGAAPDRERRLRALEADGMKLQRIPEDQRDAELCRTALRQNGFALEFVPEAVLDVYLCQRAVRTTGMALDLVPASLRSRTVCLKALRSDGLALQFVPEDLRDREVCLTAVRRNSSALRFVPAALIDEDLCRRAMRVDGRALEFVPKGLLTPSICYEAVRTSGLALSHVPGELRTPLIVARALLSAGTDVRRRTSVTYQAPPDWDEMKKTRPRDEWGRFENWTVAAPDDFPFPEDAAVSAAETGAYLAGLADEFLEASGGAERMRDGGAPVPGRGFWLEAERDGRKARVYAPALALLRRDGVDARGVPETSGAFAAAASLLDWAAGWSEDAAEPDAE